MQTHLYNARHAAVLLAAGFFAGPLALRAQEPDSTAVETNLPPIIVQASRTGKTAMAMPANVQVITGEEIARSGYSSAIEVLEKKGGIFIRKMNSNPTLTQISMRGFGENSFGRVLVLVNGERLNNPDMSSPDLLRIPMGAITRIEIIHGPQSVLYGDFAEAGVINIITDDATTQRQMTVGGSFGAYDTYSGFFNTSGEFAEEGVTYRGSFNWDKSNGYRRNSDYETYEANTAVKKTFSENNFLSVSTFYTDAEFGLPGSLTYSEYKNNPKAADKTDDRWNQDSYGLNLGGRATVGADGYIDAHFTARRRRVHTKYDYGYGSYSCYSSDIYSYAFTPQYVLTAPVAGFQNTLTVGSDLHYDSTSFNSDYYSTYYSSDSKWDYDRAGMAGYIQDEFFFTDTLSLTLGGRMEWFDNRIDDTASTTSCSSRETALEAALLYRPTDTMKYYLKTGRFYHAPFIDEIFSGPGYANLGLDPETGYNFELGSEIQLAKEWAIACDIYDMEMQHEIYYDPALYQNLNAPDNTRRLGLDASLRWSRDHVGGAALQYSAVRSEFTEGDYDGKAIPLVPAHTVGLNGEYYLVHDVALTGGFRYIAKQYLGSDFSHKGEPLSAYPLFDCGIRYEPSFVWLKGLRVTFGIDNLFGREYCDYAGWSSYSGAYYYPAQGRFWKLGASYTF